MVAEALREDAHRRHFCRAATVCRSHGASRRIWMRVVRRLTRRWPPNGTSSKPSTTRTIFIRPRTTAETCSAVGTPTTERPSPWCWGVLGPNLLPNAHRACCQPSIGETCGFCHPVSQLGAPYLPDMSVPPQSRRPVARQDPLDPAHRCDRF